MDLNRNQFLFMAVLIALIGVQLRMVSSYVLSSETTQFLAARSQDSAISGAAATMPDMLPPKVLTPPDWLGWCLISVGAVLFFHSMTMPKPSG